MAACSDPRTVLTKRDVLAKMPAMVQNSAALHCFVRWDMVSPKSAVHTVNAIKVTQSRVGFGCNSVPRLCSIASQLPAVHGVPLCLAEGLGAGLGTGGLAALAAGRFLAAAAPCEALDGDL